jgi:regulator of replication initiation timing
MTPALLTQVRNFLLKIHKGAPDLPTDPEELRKRTGYAADLIILVPDLLNELDRITTDNQALRTENQVLRAHLDELARIAADNQVLRRENQALRANLEEGRDLVARLAARLADPYPPQ